MANNSYEAGGRAGRFLSSSADAPQPREVWILARFRVEVMNRRSSVGRKVKKKVTLCRAAVRESGASSHQALLKLSK